MTMWKRFIAISILRLSEQAILNLMANVAVLRRQISRTRWCGLSQGCSNSCHYLCHAQPSDSGESGKYSVQSSR